MKTEHSRPNPRKHTENQEFSYKSINIQVITAKLSSLSPAAMFYSSGRQCI